MHPYWCHNSENSKVGALCHKLGKRSKKNFMVSVTIGRWDQGEIWREIRRDKEPYWRSGATCERRGEGTACASGAPLLPAPCRAMGWGWRQGDRAGGCLGSLARNGGSGWGCSDHDSGGGSDVCLKVETMQKKGVRRTPSCPWRESGNWGVQLTFKGRDDAEERRQEDCKLPMTWVRELGESSWRLVRRLRNEELVAGAGRGGELSSIQVEFEIIS